ncbi:MAG: RNA polymerase sigma factor [Hyphomicrobium sp.]
MSDGTDKELAGRAAAGDRAAFAALTDRHYDRVYRLAWRWSGAETLAEDIAQDVMVKLATAITSFRGESQFSTWLYRIAYAATIDHLRARQRIVPFAPSDMMMLMEAAPQGPSTGTPEDHVVGAELWQAVRALPDQQRDAVLLVYGEDLSHQEAAAIMGCSEKTVSWHLFEARKRLRVKLEAVG